MVSKVHASSGAGLLPAVPGRGFWRQALGSLEGDSQNVDMALTWNKRQKPD
jgi:hypothetical protein